jgi:hypothetical protein
MANQFGREALALDMTEFTQARTEAQERVRVNAFGSRAEKRDSPNLPGCCAWTASGANRRLSARMTSPISRICTSVGWLAGV